MIVAKVFARVFDYSSALEPGSLRFTIEWRQVVAPFARGKLVHIPSELVSDNFLCDELKLAVAEHINALQPGVDYRARDVIGCGV